MPRDGSGPSFHAAIPGFANDVRLDRDRERLLVSDSFGGAVYEVPLDAADPATAASVWVGTAADDATGLLDTASFGANGLAVGEDGAVYVAVTRVHETAGDPESDPVRGRLVRVPVAGDGSAGDPELFLESEALLGADGIAARGPQLYVAANSLNEVVRVAPSERVTTVASADDGLVFPSDVALGTTPRQRGDLFVCNFAIDTPGAGPSSGCARRANSTRRAASAQVPWRSSGDDTFLPAGGPASPVTDQPDDLATLRYVADYQFGAGAGAALVPADEPLSVERSRSGRPRQVVAEAGRLASYNTDGRLSLGLAGGRRLHAALDPPAYRVTVGEESEPFVRDGKNAFAKFVVDVDPAVRPADEVLVVDGEDRLLAVGRAELSTEGMLAFETGMAVMVREGSG